MTYFFGCSGMGLGGFFGGLFYDMNGDYFQSFAFASFMGVLNLLVLACFTMRIRGQRVNASPQPT